MDHIDTSVIVSALVQEPQTVEAERVLTSSRDLAISDWTVTEFSSALSVKLRTGGITVAIRDDSLRAFSQMLDASFTVLDVESAHFRAAARLADRHAGGIRAGDALHLAIVSAHGATLITRDKRMASAANSLGLASKLI